MFVHDLSVISVSPNLAGQEVTINATDDLIGSFYTIVDSIGKVLTSVQ